MNCEQVQKLMVSYLNHETTPSEKALMQAHLAGCSACRESFALQAGLQERIASALQRRASQALPLPDARSRLEARLAQEALPALSTPNEWFARLAPGVSRTFTQLISGDKTMIKHFIMASSVVVAAITMITILMFNKVPPVSAQSILDRASQVQTQTAPAKGIEHISYETFFNLEGLPEDQVAGTIQDFYFDYETCNNKRVMINSKTGVVLDVFANDGTYTYGGFNYDINASGPLTVYRSPKDPAGDRCEKPYAGGDRKDLFDQMRSDPNVQIVGQETWAGGHKVYVLRSQTQIRLLGKNNQYKSAPGQLINYFDADTYQFYGGKEVIRGQDGKDLMIDEKLFSVDEFLPDGSRINWDLSDVKGIQMIDDPDGTHRDSGARG